MRTRESPSRANSTPSRGQVEALHPCSGHPAARLGEDVECHRLALDGHDMLGAPRERMELSELRTDDPPASKTCDGLGNGVRPACPQLLGQDPKGTAAAWLIGHRGLDDEYGSFAFDQHPMHEGKTEGPFTPAGPPQLPPPRKRPPCHEGERPYRGNGAFRNRLSISRRSQAAFSLASLSGILTAGTFPSPTGP